MQDIYINSIETAIPENECHTSCIDFLEKQIESEKTLDAIKNIIPNLGISKRYSVLNNLFISDAKISNKAFYEINKSPSTATRMEKYQAEALPLASEALRKLFWQNETREITHILITSCTGFYSPGLDLEIIERFKLNPAIERTMIGFMGCHAAINALKLAKHIARSDENAKILMINIELCSLHFQKDPQLNQLISYLIFADGCAASIISQAPYGLKLESFNSTLVVNSKKAMTWNIADDGFSIYLDKSIPVLIKRSLPEFIESLTDIEPKNLKYWAVHSGGKGILDTVETVLSLNNNDLSHSRRILDEYGNLSSATIMFILKDIMDSGTEAGSGLCCAFGPGLSIESFGFKKI
jgi:predicted naringenin-chalcone synthase